MILTLICNESFLHFKYYKGKNKKWDNEKHRNRIEKQIVRDLRQREDEAIENREKAKLNRSGVSYL